MMKPSRWILIPLLVGCASARPEAPPPASATPEETRELTDAVHWMRNSAEYQAVMRQAFQLAGERLETIAAQMEPGTWAVSVDADETAIDNSQYAKELSLAGRESTDELWDRWVARRAAPPTPGVIAFLERVHDLGGRIAVVTNRIDAHCPDTEAKFRAYEIPFDVILCRTDGRQKEPRWRMIESGETPAGLPPLEVVMWLGDNIGDFPDLDQEIRDEDGKAFDGFGDRYFVLPNPTYGSWEDNPQD